MAEIESQFARIDQRSFLLHAFAEHFAQRPVGQVRGGVILHDGRSRHDGANGIADFQRSFFQPADVQHISADDFCVRHAKKCSSLIDYIERAAVADLSAHFRVKIRAIQNDRDLLILLDIRRRKAQIAAVPDRHDMRRNWLGRNLA